MAHWWQKATDTVGLTNYGATEAAENAYDRTQAAAEAASAQNDADISAYLGNAQGMYGEGASKYDSALSDYLNGDTYQADGFSYDKTADDFADPYEQQAESKAAQGIAASRSAGGSYFSSGAADETADAMQKMQSDAAEKAYDRMMTDRNEAREEYATNADNAYKEWQSKNDKLKAAADAYGADRDSLFAAQGDALSQQINNRNSNLSTTAQVTSGKANAALGQTGVLKGLLSIL